MHPSIYSQTTSNIITDPTFGMMNGIKKVTDLIRPTYGGNGSNAIIESRLRPGHMIANDAQTVIQAIKLTDPAEKRGLAFLQEICDRTDKMSGDGRKTTIILTEEILRLGHAANVSKLQLKRDLDELIPLVELEIQGQIKEITLDDVAQVASVAGESVELGQLLQVIYNKIGKDGIIHPEGSGTYETTYKFIDGVRFDMAAIISPFLFNETNKAVYENPTILVTKKKITTDDDINPLLNQMRLEGKKDLVIFTNDMDSGVAAMLIDLHKSKLFNICIIKAPSLWQDYYFEDFAKCTGSTVVEDASGLNLRKLPLDVLGSCGKIIVDQDETILIGTHDITEHIKRLQEKGDDDSKLRLAWLTNKTVILRLGANSETDLSYKRLKCHDAIRSTELALRYGIVPGGGIALYRAADGMPDTVAGNILREALKAPFEQIAKNGCVATSDVVDASKVVSTAVRNAIGIASTVLTASGLVYLPDPTPYEMQLANTQTNAF